MTQRVIGLTPGKITITAKMGERLQTGKRVNCLHI